MFNRRGQKILNSYIDLVLESINPRILKIPKEKIFEDIKMLNPNIDIDNEIIKKEIIEQQKRILINDINDTFYEKRTFTTDINIYEDEKNIIIDYRILLFSDYIYDIEMKLIYTHEKNKDKDSVAITSYGYDIFDKYVMPVILRIDRKPIFHKLQKYIHSINEIYISNILQEYAKSLNSYYNTDTILLKNLRYDFISALLCTIKSYYLRNKNEKELQKVEKAIHDYPYYVDENDINKLTTYYMKNENLINIQNYDDEIKNILMKSFDLINLEIDIDYLFNSVTLYDNFKLFKVLVDNYTKFENRQQRIIEYIPYIMKDEKYLKYFFNKRLTPVFYDVMLYLKKTIIDQTEEFDDNKAKEISRNFLSYYHNLDDINKIIFINDVVKYIDNIAEIFKIYFCDNIQTQRLLETNSKLFQNILSNKKWKETDIKEVSQFVLNFFPFLLVLPNYGHIAFVINGNLYTDKIEKHYKYINRIDGERRKNICDNILRYNENLRKKNNDSIKNEFQYYHKVKIDNIKIYITNPKHIVHDTIYIIKYSSLYNSSYYPECYKKIIFYKKAFMLNNEDDISQKEIDEIKNKFEKITENKVHIDLLSYIYGKKMIGREWNIKSYKRLLYLKENDILKQNNYTNILSDLNRSALLSTLSTLIINLKIKYDIIIPKEILDNILFNIYKQNIISKEKIEIQILYQMLTGNIIDSKLINDYIETLISSITSNFYSARKKYWAIFEGIFNSLSYPENIFINIILFLYDKRFILRFQKSLANTSMFNSNNARMALKKITKFLELLWTKNDYNVLKNSLIKHLNLDKLYNVEYFPNEKYQIMPEKEKKKKIIRRKNEKY